MLAQYGTMARLGPELDWFDRIDTFARATALPGQGYFPRVDFEMVLSHRPPGPERRLPFTRWRVSPSVFLWHWASTSSRFALRGEAAYFVDFPLDSDRPSEIAGSVVGAYDFVVRRGIADFGPGEGFFASRQAEGYKPPVRLDPRRYPYWEELP
jgi:hypothetical protein